CAWWRRWLAACSSCATARWWRRAPPTRFLPGPRVLTRAPCSPPLSTSRPRPKASSRSDDLFPPVVPAKAGTHDHGPVFMGPGSRCAGQGRGWRRRVPVRREVPNEHPLADHPADVAIEAGEVLAHAFRPYERVRARRAGDEVEVRDLLRAG